MKTGYLELHSQRGLRARKAVHDKNTTACIQALDNKDTLYSCYARCCFSTSYYEAVICHCATCTRLLVCFFLSLKTVRSPSLCPPCASLSVPLRGVRRVTCPHTEHAFTLEGSTHSYSTSTRFLTAFLEIKDSKALRLTVLWTRVAVAAGAVVSAGGRLSSPTCLFFFQ